MSNWLKKAEGEEHNFWMSYTDLMAGFLVVFIIISVILYYQFNYQIQQTKEAENRAMIAQHQYEQALKDIEQIKIANDRIKFALDSIKEHDLKNQILKYREVFVFDENIHVEFNTERGSIILTHRKANGQLFQPGYSTMQPELQKYIDKIAVNLVAKTISVWQRNGYKDIELRIEGHTDPTWGGEPRGSNKSYIENLTLSSDRANNVYYHILNNPNLNSLQRYFVECNMISIGYSFSNRVRKGNIEDKSLDAGSRRIEFRIISR